MACTCESILGFWIPPASCGEESGFYILLCHFLHRRFYKAKRKIHPFPDQNKKVDLRAPPSLQLSGQPLILFLTRNNQKKGEI